MIPIHGFEDTHVVSIEGLITALPKIVEQPNHPNQKLRVTNARILRPGDNKKGYLFVYLNNGRGKKERRYVHRIVAEAYIPNPNNLAQINHKDLNKHNNNMENLEWCSCIDNVRHYLRSVLVRNPHKKGII